MPRDDNISSSILLESWSTLHSTFVLFRFVLMLKGGGEGGLQDGVDTDA